MRRKIQRRRCFLLEVSRKLFTLGSADSSQVCRLVKQRTPRTRKNVSFLLLSIYANYYTRRSLEGDPQPQKAQANGRRRRTGTFSNEEV